MSAGDSNLGTRQHYGRIGAKRKQGCLAHRKTCVAIHVAGGNFDLRARVVLALLALVATKFVMILA